ncbi:hypothetical protein BP6252_07133 [Coleophoma cylindrospora]|uniref:Uncharacterized protein n=1 Tax=Coleophoma cylindrospora TaxID=1849047 RepID=A0A3D8RGY2_9HELO|nr:hypothetical protein BP6252_07133 [Coleophoma cylindrospora]
MSSALRASLKIRETTAFAALLLAFSPAVVLGTPLALERFPRARITQSRFWRQAQGQFDGQKVKHALEVILRRGRGA